MKSAILAFCAVLMIGSALAPTLAEAKSVKWSCYAPDPLNPFNFVCTASSSRP